MREMSEQRRLVESERGRHRVRWGFLWGVHWENLPWLETCCTGMLKVSGLWKRGFANALAMGVERPTLTFGNLPEAFDGFRILWVSDLHIEPLDGLVERVLALSGDLAYDICVLGGDYCFEDAMTPVAAERTQRLTAALVKQSAVYAILGNHDEYAMGQVLEDAGARVLVNEHVMLERAGQRVCLAGVDDPHYYGAADLQAAMAGADGGCFKILLCHSPELYRQAGAAGVDLFLAGHTHGGQVCLPNGFAPVTCTSAPRRMLKGLWRHEGMTGYTSRGAGASGIPVRFNCPGEVTLLTLKKELKL